MGAESYSRAEEIVHSITAALGVAAMLLGIPWLVMRATDTGATDNSGAWRLVGALAFGCGALMMFAMRHGGRPPRHSLGDWITRRYTC
jgi:predicted membrane channel-forming protein YqfA (hemolysin III family)